MEGVGARLGRSSTRYGPATVFNGPVRKWKKRWVHVSPSSNSQNHQHQHHHSSINNNHNLNNSSSISAANGASHLLLYKWTPLTQSNNKDISNISSIPTVDTKDPSDDPPKRKFKYIPVYELEKQKKEAAEQEAAENGSNEVKPNDIGPIMKNDDFGEKPDINDVPMEESQSPDDNLIRQDLNESTLDLSLGWTSHDGDTDDKRDHARDGQLERLNGSSGT